MTEPVAPHHLITYQRGTLPIIISAPHGGITRIPGSKDRTRGVMVRDVLTNTVAQLIAQRLTDSLGEKPSMVVAQFSRKDADGNRSREDGVENDAAGEHYDAYHKALRMLVDECRASGKPALLIDIHGQARVPTAIIRGTRNGSTVTKLVERKGDTALTGPESVFGYLKRKGYHVLPDLDPDHPEQNTEPETFFDGGYIVGTYGSQHADGVDAIQIEIGGLKTDNVMRVSRDLADAIAACYREHVAVKPAPDPASADESPAAPKEPAKPTLESAKPKPAER